MSVPSDEPVPQGSHDGDALQRARRHLHEAELAAAALLILSAIGIGVTDISPDRGFRYWLAMVPVFALVSGVVEFRHREGSRAQLARRFLKLVGHWAGAFGAIYLVMLFRQTGRINAPISGLAALLVLAFASFESGVHLDPRLLPVGLLLAATCVVVAVLEEYVWALLALAGVTLVLAVFLVWRAFRRRRHDTAALPGPNSSAAGTDSA